MKVRILYKYTSNEGDLYDDEERFFSIGTKTVLKEEVVEYDKVKKVLEDIANVAADYGDGVTNAKLLVIVNNETNEVLPSRYKFWEDDSDENSC